MAVASFLAVLFLLLCIPSGGSTALVFSGEIIHPDSPESPLYDPTSTPFFRIRAAVQHHSAALANYSNSRLLTAIDRESMYLEGSNYYGTYVVKLRIGTPPQIVFVGVSTTASLSHVLCYPLVRRGKSVLFNPNASTTYSTIPCSSDSCKSLRKFPCDSGKNLLCRYIKEKIGRSITASGYLSNETLHFENEDGIVSVPSILLGCTHKIEPSPEDEERNRSIGVLALNNKRLSLFNQMHHTLGGEMPKKFSYCFPSKRDETSKMYFGDTPASRVNSYTTPLYISAINNVYYLNLKRIVVHDGDIPSMHITVTGPQSRPKGNMLVDSRTPITFLDEIYMKAVIEDFLDLVPMEPVEVPKGLDPVIKHCFDWSKPNEDALPTIEFIFENQASIIGASLFQKVKNGVICLLVASIKFSEGIQVLGNGGQTAHRLEFNLEDKEMRITDDFCADR